MSQPSLDQLDLAAKTIAMLSADGVEKANSGHPGMPMGVAHIGAVLWLKHLKYSAKDTKWLNRDRFVLSNGHGSMFLYSMLHLSGYELSLDDLKNFRQWGSKTPGHPENTHTPGVECTTGPLGQGISNAVGMALAGKVMAARYNTPANSPFTHHVYCMVGDGCLMEGISSEASSLAGHLGLGNLIAIYDDNHISIAGSTDLAFSEDVAARYRAYGWQTIAVDGHNPKAIDEALEQAKSQTAQPTLILARTTIGFGSPNKANTCGVHGSPLGASEMKSTKENLQLPSDKSFYIPEEVKQLFANRAEELSSEFAAWQSSFSTWKNQNPTLASTLDRQLSEPDIVQLDKALFKSVQDSTAPTSKAIASRKISQMLIQGAASVLESFIGGSADLEPSTLTLIKDGGSIGKDKFAGKNIHYGVREHAMGAMMNGLALYGGFIPFGSTFMCFSDYMKPAIRLAALSKIRSLFVFTHDSIFLGEDGPTHQPVEHLAALRAVPNLYVFRPANAQEAAGAYSKAIESQHTPSVLVFSRQNISMETTVEDSFAKSKRGAYTIFDNGKNPEQTPELVIVGTGSELPLALASAKSLSGTMHVRVVSMPCAELYLEQSPEQQQKLIPCSCPTVVVEAASSFGWASILPGRQLLVIGQDDFGASAPAEILAEKFGFTEEAVVKRIGQFVRSL